MDWGPSIETLRGLAVVLVFLSHSLGHWLELSGVDSGALKALYTLTFQVDFGRLGVYVFFLISGFLVPFSIKGVGWSPANDFLRRRFLRIAPMYFLSIPLGLVLEHWLQGRSVSASMLLQNLLLIPNFFNNPYALNAYWTLQIEFAFYLVTFMIAVKFDLRRNRNVLPVVFLLTVLLAEFIRPHHYSVSPETAIFMGEMAKILGGMTFLWLGALIRNSLDQGSSRLEANLLRFYALYAFIYLPMRHFKNMDIAAPHPTLSFLVPALAILIFYLAVSRGIRRSGLEMIGTTSYSMYLLHAPVIYIVKYTCMALVSIHGGEHSTFSTVALYDLAGILFLSITFLLSLLVSRWSYQRIELQFWEPTSRLKPI